MASRQISQGQSLLSADFDATQALRPQVEVDVPCPNAPTLSNLAEYASRSTGHRGSGRPVPKTDPVTLGRQSSSSSTTVVQFVHRPRRAAKNVLTIMETIEGPLARLRLCIQDKTRIKVWTRRHREVRGVCCGRVLAFDRHWNIVLADVDESYVLDRQPSKTKTPSGVANSCRNLIDVLASGLHRRHVAQLLVRGDNVAFVSIPTESS